MVRILLHTTKKVEADTYSLRYSQTKCYRHNDAKEKKIKR